MNKLFCVLKWPECGYEKYGSRIIIMIKTGFCVKFVRKCIYCGFWNTVVYVYDFNVRYTWYNRTQKYFRFTKSSGNLEILTRIHESSLLMSSLRAIVICQKYLRITVISSKILVFAPSPAMRRWTLWISQNTEKIIEQQNTFLYQLIYTVF